MLELSITESTKAINLYGEIVKVSAPAVGAVRALRGHAENKDPFETIELMSQFLKQCGLSDEHINKIQMKDFEPIVKYVCGEDEKK